jgi:hypothetical protein
MRFFLPLVIVSLWLSACTSQKNCANKKHIISNIDTSKPYTLNGKYCICSKKDTMINGNYGLVSVNVYDRTNGNIIKDGVVWFNGVDTLKAILNVQTNYIQVTEGIYDIVISNSNYHALKTKPIKIQKNKLLEMNFYLGNSVKW